MAMLPHLRRTSEICAAPSPGSQGRRPAKFKLARSTARIFATASSELRRREPEAPAEFGIVKFDALD